MYIYVRIYVVFMGKKNKVSYVHIHTYQLFTNLECHTFLTYFVNCFWSRIITRLSGYPLDNVHCMNKNMINIHTPCLLLSLYACIISNFKKLNFMVFLDYCINLLANHLHSNSKIQKMVSMQYLVVPQVNGVL